MTGPGFEELNIGSIEITLMLQTYIGPGLNSIFILHPILCHICFFFVLNQSKDHTYRAPVRSKQVGSSDRASNVGTLVFPVSLFLYIQHICMYVKSCMYVCMYV